MPIRFTKAVQKYDLRSYMLRKGKAVQKWKCPMKPLSKIAKMGADARRWLSSQKGMYLSSGELLPRKYFREAYKAYRNRAKHYMAVKRGLKIAAISLFGKDFETKPEGKLVQSVLDESLSPQASKSRIKATLNEYLSTGGTIEKAGEISKKFEYFAEEQFKGKTIAKMSDSRHMIAVKIYEPGRYLVELLDEIKKK